MVRISNSLLPANSAGIPQNEITNSSIAVTGSFYPATQPVSAASLPLPTNAASETTLSTLNGKVTACDTGAVVVSSGSINATCSGSVAVSGVSGTVTVDGSGVTQPVSGTFYQATQPVSIAATVQVAASSTINGTKGNLSLSSSVVNGDTSTAVDVGSYTKNTIFINTTGNDEIKILLSYDGGTNYHYLRGCYPMNGDCVEVINDVVCDRIQLEYTGSATVTATVVSRA